MDYSIQGRLSVGGDPSSQALRDVVFFAYAFSLNEPAAILSADEARELVEAAVAEARLALATGQPRPILFDVDRVEARPGSVELVIYFLAAAVAPAVAPVAAPVAAAAAEASLPVAALASGAVAGIAGGLLQEVGKDIWGRCKSLLRQKRGASVEIADEHSAVDVLNEAAWRAARAGGATASSALPVVASGDRLVVTHRPHGGRYREVTVDADRFLRGPARISCVEELSLLAAGSGPESHDVRAEPAAKTAPPAPEAARPLDSPILIDLRRAPDEVVITASAAGVRPEDLKVGVSSRTITIEGEIPASDAPASGVDLLREHRRGPIRREVDLPVDVQPAGARATAVGGYLVVCLPIALHDRPRIVPVEVASPRAAVAARPETVAWTDEEDGGPEAAGPERTAGADGPERTSEADRRGRARPSAARR
jgi:HSP20 family molecular chaperone IbpA